MTLGNTSVWQKTVVNDHARLIAGLLSMIRHYYRLVSLETITPVLAVVLLLFQGNSRQGASSRGQSIDYTRVATVGGRISVFTRTQVDVDTQFQ